MKICQLKQEKGMSYKAIGYHKCCHFLFIVFSSALNHSHLCPLQGQHLVTCWDIIIHNSYRRLETKNFWTLWTIYLGITHPAYPLKFSHEFFVPYQVYAFLFQVLQNATITTQITHKRRMGERLVLASK